MYRFDINTSNRIVSATSLTSIDSFRCQFSFLWVDFIFPDGNAVADNLVTTGIKPINRLSIGIERFDMQYRLACNW